MNKIYIKKIRFCSLDFGFSILIKNNRINIIVNFIDIKLDIIILKTYFSFKKF